MKDQKLSTAISLLKTSIHLVDDTFPYSREWKKKVEKFLKEVSKNTPDKT